MSHRIFAGQVHLCLLSARCISCRHPDPLRPPRVYLSAGGLGNLGIRTRSFQSTQSTACALKSLSGLTLNCSFRKPNHTEEKHHETGVRYVPDHATTARRAPADRKEPWLTR